jgi:hypothetical protein
MTAKYSEIWQASNHAGSLIPGMVYLHHGNQHTLQIKAFIFIEKV